MKTKIIQGIFSESPETHKHGVLKRQKLKTQEWAMIQAEVTQVVNKTYFAGKAPRVDEVLKEVSECYDCRVINIGDSTSRLANQGGCLSFEEGTVKFLSWLWKS